MCLLCDPGRALKKLSTPRTVRNPYTGKKEIRTTDHVCPGFTARGRVGEYKPLCWETKNRLRNEKQNYRAAMADKAARANRGMRDTVIGQLSAVGVKPWLIDRIVEEYFS
jgi:hypothetical protein